MKTYLVGGAVRDKLLGDIVSEKDWVVVGGTPSELLDMGFRKVGRDFPVFLHPETGEEYALARTERKTGKGYTGFECFADRSVTLSEDLKRRDLTINAIAMDSAGEIIDPFNGRADLASKTIRHISESFCEDPLRVVRLARFAAKLYPKGFKVADATKKLLRSMVNSGELRDLTPSRVWQELYKVLHEDRPDIFFVVLRKCGALKVLFKEISDMFEYSDSKINYGEHMLKTLRNAVGLTNDIHVRFAVICHNFDKIMSKSCDNIDTTLILNFCEKHLVPNAFKEFAIKFAKEKSTINSSQLQAKQYLGLLDRIDAFRRPKQLAMLLTACLADTLENNGSHKKQYELWSQCLSVAKDVDVQGIIQQGYTKSEISEQIHFQRTEKIQAWIESL